MRSPLVLLLLFSTVVAGSADSTEFAVGHRETGPIVITELTIRGGILSFRSDSGGCTDAESFVIDVVPEEGVTATIPHYRVTIRRVVADDCKSIVADGALIEIDLEKDLGLTGYFTVSVENPVYLIPTAGQ